MSVSSKPKLKQSDQAAMAGGPQPLAFDASNLVAWHDRTGADHKQQVDKYAALGFRTISLCIYGDPAQPLYAAVMVKRPVLVAEKQFFAMSADQWQQTFNDMSAQGFGPYIVTATGPANAPTVAASFRPITPTPLTRSGITVDEFRQLNDEAYADGAFLQWVDTYGTPGDTRYIATWWPNPNLDAWTCAAVDVDNATLQQHFDAQTAAGSRPVRFAITPSGRFVESFTDTTIGPWASRGNMTSSGYQSAFNEMAGKGLWPVCVAAKGSGGATRFAAIFAAREEVDQRTFRAHGPVTNAQIDGAIETYMQANGLRGAALAIVDGTRLVYAKGYTWAEPGYKDVQPTTLFRQASCSKIFVAMALYRILQEKRKALGPHAPTISQMLDSTTLQSVLALTTPDGKPPADSRFASITLRHLLESTSGIDNGLIYASFAAATAFHQPPQLPCSREQLARYGASLMLGNDPGDPTKVVYGNAAYFMLSQVVKTLGGAASFEDALTPTVLNPLGMTRTRESRSRISDQAADEAWYHLTQYAPSASLVPLPVAPSLRSSARPLVADQYGGDGSGAAAWPLDYENFSGCGGLSVAVVDLARLAASLSLRQGNPVLSADTIDEWLTNAATATHTLTGPNAHGYHGWDGMNADSANHVYWGSKGGWLPGHQSDVTLTTGGLTYIIAINGNERTKVEWLNPVADIASKHDWGTSDLFAQFGMASFPAAPATKSIAISWPPAGVMAREVVQASMIPKGLRR